MFFVVVVEDYILVITIFNLVFYVKKQDAFQDTAYLLQIRKCGSVFYELNVIVQYFSIFVSSIFRIADLGILNLNIVHERRFSLAQFFLSKNLFNYKVF